MIDLDRRIAGWPLRVWGLVVNLFGNGLAIYGALGLFRDGSGMPHFVIGAALTVACIVFLATPSRPDP
jgi:hypothetical protein